MRAAIYARTCLQERANNTVSIPNQLESGKALAQEHGLSVDAEHIFTDVEKSGELMPTCWSGENAESRPALSQMITCIEEGEVSRVVVRRPDTLGSSSNVLCALLDLFDYYDIRIILPRDSVKDEDDIRTQFAFSILRPRIQLESEQERLRRERVKTKKIEEIQRLQARIARLEAEIAEL